MKKVNIISLVAIVLFATAISSCNGKRNPGRVYMPDMGYSQAYETYAGHDTMFQTTNMYHKGGNQFFYNSMPVAGTIKRGELHPYTMTNDTVGYARSATVKNPMDTIRFSMAEAARLYNINCGICHGDKGAGNGPIAAGGFVGGVANLTLPLYVSMADGTMFHSITYGRNLMGSYAAQLSREQRWMVVKYIRTLQAPAAAPAGADSAKAATATTTATPAAADTATK